MKQYLIYLRKSRTDVEAEARGEGETLVRHETILKDLALKLNINVKEIYKEVVSGETIVARPMMQRLLTEVEQGLWDGVLVMEVERLARGDTIDQGLVAQAFKYSNTEIITPNKTYDPKDEFDEEYFEFGLFMSRREYKTINRRLQRGRLQSVKEGKFVGSIAPFGYKRVPLKGQKGFTLEPDEIEAPIVQLIYDLYVHGEDGQDYGTSLVTHKLNELSLPTRTGAPWSFATVKDILNNPVYTGHIRWGKRKEEKKIIDGDVVITRPHSDDYSLVKGLHTAIVDQATFDKAQLIRASNRRVPAPRNRIIKNPLAGLIICGLCDRPLQRRPYNYRSEETLICKTPNCECVSSFLHLVEYKLLETLAEWLEAYKVQVREEEKQGVSIKDKVIKKAIKNTDTEIAKLELQLSNLHDLLEQGVYNFKTFNERKQSVITRKEKMIANKGDLQEQIQKNNAIEIKKAFIPLVEHVIKVYASLETAKEKNDLLKTVLNKVEYTKEEGGRHTGILDNFELSLYPKVLKY